jgi:putative transposase
MPTDRRSELMDIVTELADPKVPVQRACEAIGLSRATLYRKTSAPRLVQPSKRGPSPRRLSEAQRAMVLSALHSSEFADQPPHEVFATLLSRGEYLASIRTMYRILADHNEVRERRNQRRPMAYAKPSLTAIAPNQIWTWDITKLATTVVGVFLHAYVIIDLYSRYVVGWLVAAKECKHIAAQLFAETIARHGIEPGLTVHADRGAAMKSDTLAQLLATLGAERSFSRPHVSDDNAFSEAQFKTLKYQPDYPGRFSDERHARTWLACFFGWHNGEHHHSGLALFTPAEVFFGRVEDVRIVRQAALDRAFAEHPERFPNGPPRARLPPISVSINPVTSNIIAVDGPDKTQKEELGGEVRVPDAPIDQFAPHAHLDSKHNAPDPLPKTTSLPGALKRQTRKAQGTTELLL